MSSNMITLTDSAKDYIYSIAVKNNKKIVTFGVLGGGCAGFQYKFEFSNKSFKSGLRPASTITSAADEFSDENLNKLSLISSSFINS